jgi:hypothetical protein
MKATLEISVQTKQKLAEMASQAGLSADKLAEVLLDSFVDNGGKIYVGEWEEGPGVRILPDWPRFSSSVVKVKTE